MIFPSSRAQSGLEIMLVLSLAFVFFMALVLVYFDRQQTVTDIQETLEMRALASEGARKFNAVVAAGNFSNATFIMPYSTSNGKQLCYAWLQGSNGIAQPVFQVYFVVLDAEGAYPVIKDVSVPLLTNSFTSYSGCVGDVEGQCALINNVNGRIAIGLVLATAC